MFKFIFKVKKVLKLMDLVEEFMTKGAEALKEMFKNNPELKKIATEIKQLIFELK